MRAVFGLAAIALLAFATTAPVNPPSYPSEEAVCGRSYIGVVRGGSGGGNNVLTMTVVVSCKEEPRITVFGFELGVRCSPERREVRFYRTQDGAKDYTVSEPVFNQTCCSGKALLTNGKQRQAKQICVDRP